MMKFTKRLLLGLAFCGLLQQPAMAADVGRLDSFASYALEGPQAGGLTPLEAATMADTQGQIWALPLAIASIDMALMGFFWGVYIPYIAPLPAGDLDLYQENR